jgi:hypothetical protein
MFMLYVDTEYSAIPYFLTIASRELEFKILHVVKR